MNRAPMKILVVRFSSLGDIVLLTSLFEMLGAAFPGCELHLATKRLYAELFEQDPRIAGLHLLEGKGITSLLTLRARLSRIRYDAVIDAHNVIRSSLLVGTLRTHRKVVLGKRQLHKMLLIRAKRNFLGDAPSIVKRYLELGERLGARDGRYAPRIHVPPQIGEKTRSMLRERGLAGTRLVALAPGARWETKRWPAGHAAKLVDLLNGAGVAVALVGGPEDVQISKEIGGTVTADRVADFTGRLSVLETAALLAECRALVTNDSAPLHMAEAVGTPVVALYGPTVREFGYYPVLPSSVALEIALPCRPCSRNGSRPCPLGTKECLNGIAPERVRDGLLGILEGW